jgi:hypothetical protein
MDGCASYSRDWVCRDSLICETVHRQCNKRALHLSWQTTFPAYLKLVHLLSCAAADIQCYSLAAGHQFVSKGFSGFSAEPSQRVGKCSQRAQTELRSC